MKVQERIENKWYTFKHRHGYLILWFSLLDLDFLIESIAQITRDSTSTE